MTNLNFLNAIKKVFTAFEEISKWAVQGRFKVPANLFPKIDRLEFDDLLNSFGPLDRHTFLTQKPLIENLSAIYSKIKDEPGLLEQLYPAGWQVTLAALPCDSSGLEFKAHHLNDTLPNHGSPYLFTLRTNPADQTDQTVGIGSGPNGAPFIRLIPEENIKDTSFIIKYPSEDEMVGKKREDAYFEAFAFQYIEAYIKLRKKFFPK